MAENVGLIGSVVRKWSATLMDTVCGREALRPIGPGEKWWRGDAWRGCEACAALATCAGCGDIDPRHWRDGWYCEGCAACEVCQSPYSEEPEHRG